MAFRNLLIWNPDLNLRIAGYNVTYNATTVLAKSNVYVDPTPYADEAAARAVTYAVNAVYDTIEGPALDAVLGSPDTVSLDISRWSFDTTDIDFCRLTGRISTGGGASGSSDMRVSVYWMDQPHLVSGYGYLSAEETIFHTNCRGEFAIPLVRRSRLLLHIPVVHLHSLIIVPDTDTLDIKDADLEPIEIRRNQ